MESFAKTDDKKMRKTSVSENMSFQKNFYFQGSFEEKKFTSFLKTDDENNYIMIIKNLLLIVYNII